MEQNPNSLWDRFGDGAPTMMCTREPGPILLGDTEQRARGIVLPVCKIQVGTDVERVSHVRRKPGQASLAPLAAAAAAFPSSFHSASCKLRAWQRLLGWLLARLPSSGATGCYLAGSYKSKSREPFLSWV